jgi:glycerol kinase
MSSGGGGKGRLVAALDQGTSSTRVILFNEQGHAEYTHQVAVGQQCPAAGWVEEDADEILRGALLCLDNAGQWARAQGRPVAAVGVTNQRETTVAWSKATGKPLCSAIVWLDTRTKDTADRVVANSLAGNKDALRQLCGLPVATYFSALKIRWLLDNVPAAATAAT